MLQRLTCSKLCRWPAALAHVAGAGHCQDRHTAGEHEPLMGRAAHLSLGRACGSPHTTMASPRNWLMAARRFPQSRTPERRQTTLHCKLNTVTITGRCCVAHQAGEAPVAPPQAPVPCRWTPPPSSLSLLPSPPRPCHHLLRREVVGGHARLAWAAPHLPVHRHLQGRPPGQRLAGPPPLPARMHNVLSWCRYLGGCSSALSAAVAQPLDSAHGRGARHWPGHPACLVTHSA